MKRTLSICLASCVLLMLILSCASTPKPVPEEPVVQEDPVVEAALPETEYAKAKELRETIASYKLAPYARDEFNAGEEQFGIGEKQYNADNAASKTALESAIAHYTTVIEIGSNAILSDLQKRADASRAAAVDAGAESMFPEQFALAVSRYDAAGNERKKAGYQEAGKLFLDAANMFDALALKVDIVKLDEMLARYQLEQYVSEDAARVRTLYTEAEKQFSGDTAAALEAYRQANGIGKSTLEKAAVMLTEAAKGSADDSRALADSVKASVAMKQEYAAAGEMYNKGLQALKNKRYEDAYTMLDTSAKQFAAVYKLTLEKRNRAETALDQARHEMQKLESLAREAEVDLETSEIEPTDVKE